MMKMLLKLILNILLRPQKDYDLEKRAKSNAGYHYLGSVKTYSLIGQAFADALLKLQVNRN